MRRSRNAHYEKIVYAHLDRCLRYNIGQLCDQGLFRSVSNSHFHRISLAQSGILDRLSHTEPRLGYWPTNFGPVAEKLRDRGAIVIGAFTYVIWLILSAGAVTPIEHQFYKILIGFGIAGIGFGVVLAVVGRASNDENRSMSLAIATVSGSGGQVIGPLLAAWLLSMMAWQAVFVIYAAMILAV